MERLTERELRAGLGLLRTMAMAGSDVDAFARAGVQALPRLVASEITTLSVCDLLSGHRRVIGSPGAFSAEDQACFDRFFRSHPLVHYHADPCGPGAHRITDSIPFARFRHTALYSEYYRRIKVDHAIALPIHADSRTLVSFVLNRHGRDFSDRERAALELLRQPLAGLYQQAHAVQRARAALTGLSALLERTGSAWMRLGPDGELREASVQALAWVGRYAAASPRLGTHLPPPLDRWCRQSLAMQAGAIEVSSRGDGSAAPTAAAELTLTRGGNQLRVRLLPLAPTALGIAPGGYLLFEERVSLAATARFDALPLTPREREVMRWLSGGKTDREIAALIECSLRTVQKHLERIYVKLGVETRTAAVLRALSH